MAKAYLLSDVNARNLGPVAIFNNVERAFTGAFAMLVDTRIDGAASVEAATETGMLKSDVDSEPVGPSELKTMFRDRPDGDYIDLRDPATGDRVRVTYMQVR